MTITTVWTMRRRRVTAGNAVRSCGTKMRRVPLDALDVLIPLKKKQQQALLRAPAPHDSAVHAKYSTSTISISRQSLEGIVVLFAELPLAHWH